jgi:pilus assembly protein FimV
MMSNGKNPLMLMMALTMPGAANALGLGDIHVDSALNERLAAEIDIVGATPLELTDLRAAVANRETFLRYGADRPAFLSSATFKVTQDGQGRPVLAVRSTEAFTEPLVNFLVDLRWHNGELVRQYTLLLDPTGFGSANAAATVARATDAPAPTAPDVPATAPAATPVVETKTQTVARQADPSSEHAARKTTHIKVGAKATLRGVAWRVGERSESDLQRMMIAIFRANPSAFDGNINRLHRGAMLTIPSRAEVAVISKSEAKREIHAQMTAWRAGARTMTAKTPVPGAAEPAMAESAPAKPAAAAAPTPVTAAPVAGATSDSSAVALDHRIHSLEQELTQLKGVLDSEQVQLVTMQQQEARADKAAPSIPAPQAIQHRAISVARSADRSQSSNQPAARPKTGHTAILSIIAGLGILAGTLTALYFRIRRRARVSNTSAADAPAMPVDAMADTLPDSAQVETQGGVTEAVKEPAIDHAQDREQDYAGDHAQTDVLEILTGQSNDATHPMLPVLAAPPAGRSESTARASRSAPHDTTVNMRVETADMRADTTMRVDATRLDYNLVDLDLTAQHVQMPSVLNEHAVIKERRTNLADVLKLAIEREPDRHDLRMKLLELYYAAAATNRQAFLDVVQKFARDRDYLKTDQWDKIAFMGRQIASESPLFAEAAAVEDDLADCA